MRTQLTECRTNDQPDFVLTYDPKSVLDRDVHFLKQSIESSVASGIRYRPGETLQIGWVITQIQLRSNGFLALREPDFVSVPIQWIESVTRTLRHLRLQKDVAESLDMVKRIDFPSLSDSAIIATEVPANCPRYFMSRCEKKGADSGWFLGLIEPGVNYDYPLNLRRLSLYEIAVLLPSSVMFMCLPARSLVTVDDGHVEFLFDGERIPAARGSFMHRLLAQTSAPSLQNEAHDFDE